MMKEPPFEFPGRGFGIPEMRWKVILVRKIGGGTSLSAMELVECKKKQPMYELQFPLDCEDSHACLPYLGCSFFLANVAAPSCSTTRVGVSCILAALRRELVNRKLVTCD